MPSITTIEGYTFNNWGALTTTFTAPTSCSTQSNLMIGFIGYNSTLTALEHSEQCSTIGYYDCIPTGTVKPTTADPNPADILQRAYFSPGLYCSSGWATVGIAARNTDKSLSTSGILATKTQTWDGATVTDLVNEVTATYPITEIRTFTFDESRQSSLVGVSVMLVITLVHHQSNVKAAGTAAATSNAASRIASRPTTWDGLGTVCGVLAAGMALGVAIVL